MHNVLNWPAVWQELRDNLAKQPPCPDHPEYSHVRTLARREINDVVKADENGIVVRSHQTLNEDFIEASRFEMWWNHLVVNRSASLYSGRPNNPHPWRARIVGAIMATCLPDRIRMVNSNTIELVQ